MKEITLRVKKATVVIRSGPDHISLELDAPSPFPEMKYDPCATIETRHGYGEWWCREVLGIDPEIITVPKFKSNFSNKK